MLIGTIPHRPKLWSNEWFQLWQPLLLLGVNSPSKSMREDVRRRLGIVLDRNIPVDRLMRNSFRIFLGKNSKGENEYQETFYTKPVFAIALEKEWNWFWQLIHKYDLNFANCFPKIPRLNLGFDTLTKYSTAGAGGISFDTYSYVVSYGPYSASLTSLLSQSRGTNYFTTDNSMADELYVLTQTNSESESDYRECGIARGTITYDTSVLGSSVIISDGSFKLTCVSLGPHDVELHLVGWSGAYTNQWEIYNDWNLFGGTSYGNATIPPTRVYDVEDTITLNSSGLSAISKTGVTKLGLLTSFDFYNTTGGMDDSSGMRIYAQDSTGTATHIIITYSLPSGNPNQMII